ncbi:interferon alpha-4-like [Polypterus senegalus]|uniref:interferon alpha-4-like n=1 Tax=Polypterus senegalus TaxID=55291 RepID=UPI001964813D|nr:interferon alpha-4-like [Polypterus senegalus]
MAHLTIFALLILSCLCSGFAALPLKCNFQRNFNKENVELLKTLGGDFPKQCVWEKMKINFPVECYRSSKTSGNAFIYEVLLQIEKIFTNEGMPSSWNETCKLTFRNNIFTKVQEFKKCLPADAANISDRRLVTHFEVLQEILKEKNYSFCAWEVIRADVRSHLIQLHILAK